MLQGRGYRCNPGYEANYGASLELLPDDLLLTQHHTGFIQQIDQVNAGRSIISVQLQQAVFGPVTGSNYLAGK